MKRFISNVFVIVGINSLVLSVWNLLSALIIDKIELDRVDLIVAAFVSTSLYIHWIRWVNEVNKD